MTVIMQAYTNGIISLGGRIDGDIFQPSRLPISHRRPFVAPFWSDADTTSAGTITVGRIFNATILANIQQKIESVFPEQSDYTPRYAFVATWDSIGYFTRNERLDLVSQKLR